MGLRKVGVAKAFLKVCSSQARMSAGRPWADQRVVGAEFQIEADFRGRGDIGTSGSRLL